MGSQCSRSVSNQFLKKQDIRDQYIIGKLLGTGTFGQVRECSHLGTGEIYAVKIMERRSRYEGHWSNEAMFKREVQLLSLLDNPGIVKYFDFYKDRYFLYAVMERCEGGELFGHILECKRFSERDASNICRQILSALAYIHSLDVVHRDVKAENFMFKYSGVNTELKLIDFGMSTKLSPNNPFLTETCGSPHYLSPELIKRRYNAKADLWAVGVLVYLMLFGRYPFEGKTTEIIAKQILKKPINYQAGNVKMSPEAIDFMQSLLERDPNRRLSAKEALNHTWISGYIYSSQPLIDVINQNFNVNNKDQPDLLESIRKAHERLTMGGDFYASDMKRRAEIRHNNRLQELERQWAQRKAHAVHVVTDNKMFMESRPKLSRHIKRMHTTPSFC